MVEFGLKISRSVYSLLRHQIDQITKGGFYVFFRKFCKILTVLLIIPLVLLVRILRPLILIRFGMIDSDRIGAISSKLELYLCKKEIDKHNRIFDLFCYLRPVSNKQLMKMYSRILNITSFDELLYKCNRMFIGYKVHEVPLIEGVDGMGRDINNLLGSTKPHICFTNEEDIKGSAALRDIGLPDGAPFILFHARDSAYLDKVHTKRSRSQWAVHDYRDSNIQNYCAAAEALTERGYYALRIGSVVKEALDNTNPKVVDYATRYRTDFLDIYLMSKCQFVLGSPCGITHVAYDLFRKPIAWVNATHLEFMWTWNPSVMYIPKKYWLRDERRFMRFREIFETGVGRYSYTQEYEEYGIELVENTSEEINDLVIEMDERLKESWQTTEEDEELQKRFWGYFPKSNLHGDEIRARIGSKFLRDNCELLD